MSDDRDPELTDLKGYFARMSEFVADKERRNNVSGAQEARDTRNERWASGVRVQVRYDQVYSPSRSWH